MKHNTATAPPETNRPLAARLAAGGGANSLHPQILGAVGDACYTAAATGNRGRDLLSHDSHPLIYIHGLASSGQSFKAILLRQIFPTILRPDFEGTLDERMAHLSTVLGDRAGWVIIGSSFGGLMATIFACRHPDRVSKLILLAPALIWPDFAQSPPGPTSVPTVIYHGRADTVVPLELARPLAERIFSDLEFHVMDDDHTLQATVQAIDWRQLVQT